jgi:(p)ppGpp synthase/HD superfamily hydrolase
MRGYSERYDAALILAARAHSGQDRKGTDIPYLMHPVHVSVILLRHGFSEDVVIAGLLHDVVEDSEVPLERIESDFGASVAEMVAALTEKKVEGSRKRPWEVRKREALAKLRQASQAAVAVKAADALHGACSMARDLRRSGPSFWDSFSRGPDESLWYHRAIAAIVRERLAQHPLVDELDGAIKDLEQAIIESRDN